MTGQVGGENKLFPVWLCRQFGVRRRRRGEPWRRGWRDLTIHFVRRVSIQRRVRTGKIIVPDVARKPGLQLLAGLEGVQINAFIFHRTPQPLDEDIVVSCARVRPC